MKSILIIALWLALIIGEIRCIYKFFSCDFEPSYKAEMIYGFSTITGLGVVVGWLDFGK